MSSNFSQWKQELIQCPEFKIYIGALSFKKCLKLSDEHGRAKNTVIFSDLYGVCFIALGIVAF
jgi:hypothetical protein